MGNKRNKRKHLDETKATSRKIDYTFPRYTAPAVSTRVATPYIEGRKLVKLNNTPSITKPVSSAQRNLSRVGSGLIYTLPFVHPYIKLAAFLTNSPARYLAEDVVRKKTGVPGTTYTSNSFTPSQLDVVDTQVRARAASDKRISKKYFDAHPNDTITLSLGAKSLYPKLYNRNYGSTTLLNKIGTADGQVETILGDYNIQYYKDGYTVSDVYDFNQGQGQYKGNNNPYARVRRWAGRNGHTDKDPNSKKIKFSIKRNVNHW